VQGAALANHAGAARWAWNWGLAVRPKAYHRDRDLNAARNLARLTDGDAGPVAASSAETRNACGEGGAGQAGNGVVQLPSAKQERTRISTLKDA
jgi:hypothetical protein